MKRNILVSASILSADFASFGEEIQRAEKSGVDAFHFDLMDGHFVPNLTFGPMLMQCVRKLTKLPFHAHLMVLHPEMYFKELADAGAQMVSVHVEAATHLHGALQTIRALGMKPSIAVNPATPVSVIEPLLGDVDGVLVMSVNPGFAGQKFIELAVPKIAELKKLRARKKYSYAVEVDGGINDHTAKKVIAAGVDVLAAASYLFKAKDMRAAVKALKS